MRKEQIQKKQRWERNTVKTLNPKAQKQYKGFNVFAFSLKKAELSKAFIELGAIVKGDPFVE